MPDLNLYRKHGPSCPGVKRGRVYTKCQCPIWCDGRINGRRIHHSMKSRDWDRAERRLLGAVDPGSPVLKRRPLSDAVDAYLADCKARQLKQPTLTSYKGTLEALKEFCEPLGIKHSDQIGLELVTKFRASRTGRDGKTPMKASSQRKEIENLRGFCKFCEQREWMKSNPAKMLKPPKESGLPTLPFEQKAIDSILSACALIDNNYKESAERARTRAKALVLVLLYAGLRISDAATLERGKLDAKTGKLLIRTMKTGAPLYVKLPPSVLAALEALPVESQKYFFWSGRGKVSSIVGSLRRSMEAVLKLAEIKGHPHRFRDTFAVRLLDADVPIRTVQLLLGHSSVQTTEKHYAPFVKSTQRLLDAATDKLDFGESSSTKVAEEVAKDRGGDA